ncbi:putative hydrophobic seed protein [Dioscorea sansibarensis]
MTFKSLHLSSALEKKIITLFLHLSIYTLHCFTCKSTTFSSTSSCSILLVLELELASPMAPSKSTATIGDIFLIFNLLFFAFGSSVATPLPSPPSVNGGQCPLDNSLSLRVCANLLNGLVVVNQQCCSRFDGLAGFEAAVCLCDAIKANVFGVINVNATVAIGRTLSSCRMPAPQGFQCLN